MTAQGQMGSCSFQYSLSLGWFNSFTTANLAVHLPLNVSDKY